MRSLAIIIFYLAAPSIQQERFQAELFLNGNDLDSGLYEGEVIGRRLFGGSQVPHGKGTIYYFTTDRFKRQNYTGDWINGTREGNGTTHWRDGSTYQGEYRNGLEEGAGILRYPNGDSLVGDFASGKIHGHGVFRYASGNQREGFFNQNILEGQVIFTRRDGVTAIERWEAGKKIETLEDSRARLQTNSLSNGGDGGGNSVLAAPVPAEAVTDAEKAEVATLEFPTLWYSETHDIRKPIAFPADTRKDEQLVSRLEEIRAAGSNNTPSPKPSLFSSIPARTEDSFDLGAVLDIVKKWDEGRTPVKQ